ncbi:MAG: glutathione S-transferase N-terminal domain-containing protein [archaeon]|nr:glutathione S-transferase N-terminal domain-containing protein [archaeon]
MSSSDIVLTYFDGRGLGEGVRLMLALGGETWTEVPVKTRADFVKLRDVDQVLPYGQLPLLDFKGVRLVGSQPIVRYLGATHGLYGSTPEERYEADAAQDFARDLFSKVSGVSWVAPERLDAHINDVLKPLIAKYVFEGCCVCFVHFLFIFEKDICLGWKNV